MAYAIFIDEALTHNGRPLHRVIGHVTQSERDSIKAMLRRCDGTPVYVQFDNGSIDLVERGTTTTWSYSGMAS